MSLASREAAGEHLIDVLADLHAVDIDSIGLGDLARRDGYIERQVKRWTTQWEKSKTRELPAIDEVAQTTGCEPPRTDRGVDRTRRLSIRQPARQHHDRPASPRSSIGSSARSAIRSPTSDTSVSTGRTRAEEQLRPNDPTGIEGFPTYDELVDRYARRTGRDAEQHRVLPSLRGVATRGDLRRCVRPISCTERWGISRSTPRRSTGSRTAPSALPKRHCLRSLS